MMFPPHNDAGANVSHQVTIIATDAWTSVTVEVLERCFMRHIFLSPSDSQIVHLPPSVEITRDQSSYLLSVGGVHGLLQSSLHSASTVFVTTASFMMCPPGGPTTIPLLLKQDCRKPDGDHEH